MSDASRDGAGTWHRVGLWLGTLPGAATGAKRDVAPSRSRWCRCWGGGKQDHGRARSSRGRLAWHPGRELGETAGVPTPRLRSGGFSAAPARDVAGRRGCTSGCTSGCASTMPRPEHPRGQSGQRVLPDALAAPSSAKTGGIGSLGAGRDRQPGRRGSIGILARAPSPSPAGVSPSRGEGVKIQAPSRWKRWLGSGEAEGRTKGRGTKSLCLRLC